MTDIENILVPKSVDYNQLRTDLRARARKYAEERTALFNDRARLASAFDAGVSAMVEKMREVIASDQEAALVAVSNFETRLREINPLLRSEPLGTVAPLAGSEPLERGEPVRLGSKGFEPIRREEEAASIDEKRKQYNKIHPMHSRDCLVEDDTSECPTCGGIEFGSRCIDVNNPHLGVGHVSWISKDHKRTFLRYDALGRADDVLMRDLRLVR